MMTQYQLCCGAVFAYEPYWIISLLVFFYESQQEK